MYGHMNLASRALVARPGGGAEVLRGGVAGHGLLQFDADDQRASRYAPDRRSAIAARVATLPDAHAASWRDAGVSHSPSLTLAGIAPRWPWRANISPKALATCTTPMSAASTLRRRERAVHHFGGQVGEVVAFAGEVAREIALIAAEDPDVWSAHDRDRTTTKRVTRADSAGREGGPAGSRSEPTRPQ